MLQAVKRKNIIATLFLNSIFFFILSLKVEV